MGEAVAALGWPAHANCNAPFSSYAGGTSLNWDHVPKGVSFCGRAPKIKQLDLPQHFESNFNFEDRGIENVKPLRTSRSNICRTPGQGPPSPITA